MPAGTIALTNNSATVTGTGTSFTTELKVNDFLVSTVGGMAYTLGVKSIESNTSLTLMEKYTGPSATGQSWTPVPYGTMAAITAQLAAQVTYAIRGLNLDKANWQQIFTGTGTVTVTLPDGTSWQGPAWGGITSNLANKANTADVLLKSDNLNSLTDKSAARTNLGVAYGSSTGTVAQGNDSRLNTIGGKSGGTLTSAITVSSSGAIALTADSIVAEGTSGNFLTRGVLMKGTSSTYDIEMQYRLNNGVAHYFRLVQNSSETFSARSNGACYAVSFNPTSDSNLKFNKKLISSSLKKSMSLRGMTYLIQGERKAGVIYQDLEEVLPEATSENHEAIVLEDGTILNTTGSVDYAGVTALHTESIKEIITLMIECLDSPSSARKKLYELASEINNSLEDENPLPDGLTMQWAMLNQSVE